MKKYIPSFSFFPAVLLILAFLCFSFSHDPEKVEFTTTKVCEICIEYLEHDLKKERGIKHVEFKVEEGIIAVEYDPIKTTEEEIKERISELGFQADDYPPREDVYENLPDCCKKPEDREEE